MRICPNYEVNPIDVAGLYHLEKSLFGVMDNGLLVTPCEYFAAHNWPIADVFAGIFYLCWVPVPILFGLCLYFKKERKTYLRFALVFLFVNLIVTPKNASKRPNPATLPGVFNIGSKP